MKNKLPPRAWPKRLLFIALSTILFLPLYSVQSILIISYPHVPIIVAIFSLSLTVIIPAFQIKLGTEQKNNWKFNLAIWVSIYGIVFGIAAGYANMRYCIVPNLHGASYDTAMDVLRESGLVGRLALGETFNDISGTNSRVVWQSRKNGSIAKRGTAVFFVIADDYSESDDNVFPVGKYLPEADWEYCPDEVDKRIWHIKIPLSREYVAAQVIVPVYNADEVIIGSYIENTYRQEKININAEALAKVLDTIITEYLNKNKAESEILNSNNYICVAKLVPSDHLFDTRMLFFEEKFALVIVPSSFDKGEYQLIIAFIAPEREYRWNCDLTFIVPDEK